MTTKTKEKPIVCMNALDASEENSDLGYECFRIIDGTKPAVVFDKFSDSIDKAISSNPDEYGAGDVFKTFAKDMKGRVAKIPKNGLQIRQFDI